MQRYWRRDEFLTDAVLGCEHEYEEVERAYGYGSFDTETICEKCGHREDDVINFSNWPGFGKLWDWIHKQPWKDNWYDSIDEWNPAYEICDKLINPDALAESIYKYLGPHNDEDN